MNNEFRHRLDVLEMAAYGVEDGNYDTDWSELEEQAHALLRDVLAHYDLIYFNPGEPVAEDPARGIVIPLPSPWSNYYTDEEWAAMESGWTLPYELFEARVALAQARAIIEDGWQYGLD